MDNQIDWGAVARHLDSLYSAVDSLERQFPCRKFTPDGHLVGSIGEVVAAYMFDLTLNPASTAGHDAVAPDGRRVEVKLTQGGAIGLREQPEHLIVLQRPKGRVISVVYNGPGGPAWEKAGRMQRNGQRRITLTTLLRIAELVGSDERLPVVRQPPV
ncbi:DUF6998 domain-containing protein [Wenzhouxiangella limi]|uniref:DUF6998 domain-containing protein n=1 Tax=Wenzhouxiangella limi TaxID=2707351 RepID=A0A845UX33_9GAMM|nr:hypothetical protein [Wenzhouxiangella limi]NDY94400.1 hypothetical protein [Wenzhouxiangella limi]